VNWSQGLALLRVLLQPRLPESRTSLVSGAIITAEVGESDTPDPA